MLSYIILESCIVSKSFSYSEGKSYVFPRFVCGITFDFSEFILCFRPS